MDMICIGDSIAYGYGVRRVECWTRLASELSGWNLINQGVCGDTTGGMLVRMREILQRLDDRKKERCFLLMGGCNDIIFSGESTSARGNMAAMVHQLIREGEEPLVAIGPGIDERGIQNEWNRIADFTEVPGKLREYDEWLADFCEIFHVRTIDFRSAFVNQDGKPRAELYLDGLHPNAEGQRQLTACIAEAIREMEKERQ